VTREPEHEQIESTAESPAADGHRNVAAVASLDACCASLQPGQVGVWSWDIGAGQMTWSTRFPSREPGDGGMTEGVFALTASEVDHTEQPGLPAAMRDVLRSGEPGSMEYRLSSPPGAEERWFEVSVTLVHEADRPVKMLGVTRDVTQYRQINREVHARTRQQDALMRLSERAIAEGDLQSFFDYTVAIVAEILDVELAKIFELLPGDAEMLLRAGIGWPPDMIGTAHESTGRQSHAGYALAAGQPVIVEDIEIETRFGATQMLRDQGIVGGVSTTIAGRDGRAYGVLCVHTTKRRKFNEYDAAFLSAAANVVAGAIQRRQLDQRHELMIRELRHRSGNLFSQLLALFSQTAKSSRNIPDLVTKFEARVLALANAHRLVTEGGWKSTSLNELLDVLLAPYLGSIQLAGPHVFLEPDATLGLSMALHELIINASKYGSLSALRGRIEISWAVVRTPQGLTLSLDWKERQGPATRKMVRPGFGFKLIGMVIERQLNGQVHREISPKGLETRLIVPLTRDRWPV
jgi:two-component sensor histidine kinase